MTASRRLRFCCIHETILKLPKRESVFDLVGESWPQFTSVCWRMRTQMHRFVLFAMPNVGNTSRAFTCAGHHYYCVGLRPSKRILYVESASRLFISPYMVVLYCTTKYNPPLRDGSTTYPACPPPPTTPLPRCLADATASPKACPTDLSSKRRLCRCACLSADARSSCSLAVSSAAPHAARASDSRRSMSFNSDPCCALI